MRFDCAAILFDLDGVLVDSRVCVENAWREWAESHGLDADAVIEQAHGHRTADTIRIVAPHLDADTEAKRLETAESTHTRGLKEVPGARDLVMRLPAERWAVFTSGTHPVAEHRLRFARIPFPAVFICAEDVRRGKPDPEGYRTAAERLGIDPADCVVLEDAPTGIAAAHAAGARAIGIATTYEPSELHAANAVVRQLSEIGVATRDGRLHISVPDSAGP
jgi:sugar-phosphatase